MCSASNNWATFMLVSFRAGGWRRNIPGFNRGNVDWFPGLRAQEKNPLWRRELWRYFKEDGWPNPRGPGNSRYPCELSRARKFSQGVRERFLGAIIPRWQARLARY